jgi:hypothetical protein
MAIYEHEHRGIPIPEHLSDTPRELFVMIVDDLINEGVDVKPIDAIQIEMLASTVALLRRARKERRLAAEEDVAAVLAEIDSEQWESALSTAHELTLSDQALKRLAWEQ